jgi:hypothetical protein
MKKVLLLTVLLALSPLAKGQAAPSHVHAVGTCNPEMIQSVIHLFLIQPTAPTFQLYVFCQAQDWRDFLNRSGKPFNAIALTDWTHGKIYLGPKNLDEPTLLRQTIRHELDHLRCACLLGETS